MNDKAMFKLTYGLFVISTKVGEKDNACIINTAIQAASDPNQMSVSLNKSDYTHDMILDAGEFNVSVISKDASFDLFQRFGFQSGRDVDKYAGYNGFSRAANGITYVTEGTNTFFSVKVKQTVDLGSHTMFIGEIVDMDVLTDTESATYTYYHTNIKPKPQESAEKTGKVVWRCMICGYEYEGEELPADFVCPICKHPASDFERIVK